MKGVEIHSRPEDISAAIPAAAATTTATTTATAATATAATTATAGFRLVDGDLASVQHSSLKRLDGCYTLFLVVELDEGEVASIALAVSGDIDALQLSMDGEQLAQFLLARLVGNAADEDLESGLAGPSLGDQQFALLGQFVLARLTVFDLLHAFGAAHRPAASRFERDLAVGAAECAVDLEHLPLSASTSVAAAAATSATTTTASTPATHAQTFCGRLVLLAAAMVGQRREVGAFTIVRQSLLGCLRPAFTWTVEFGEAAS